jgi:NDP-sugar pyrophosphorylase family protein
LAKKQRPAEDDSPSLLPGLGSPVAVRAVVLAAGMGSRLGVLTENVPKPLLRLGSESILCQNLRFLSRCGVAEVAINLHHRGDEIRRAIGDGWQLDLKVVYSHEQTLLGTAGGVRQAQKLLSDSWPLLVIYGDNLVRFDLERLYALHRDSGASATISLHHVDDVRGSGIVSLDESDRIRVFVEKPALNDAQPGWVNSGIYLLEQTVIEAIPSEGSFDFGFDIFPKLLRAGEKLTGYRFGPGEFVYPIDTLERYKRSAAELAVPFSIAPSHA